MSMQDRTEAAPPGAGTPPGSAAPAPSGDKLGLALAVIAAAQLMLVLDNTIVAVALPSMQSALGLSDANLGWVITAYALAFGGLLLAGGRAGDLFGRRRVFRTGLVVFTLASLLGGLAGSGEVLLIARVLQGVGAAIAAPTALSLLASTFPAGPARNKALGVYGAMGGLGSVVGLLLGGALTEFLSWRWVMYINIPIAVAVLIGTSVLKEGERDRGKVDVPGALTATFGFGSLVYGINRAGEKGLGDSTTLIALAVAIVLIVAFIAIQRSSRAPMVPGAVVADKSRAGANAVMFLVGAGMFATFYFLTLYMQIVKGYEPMITGLA
ncbi:MFS transporter, partial [Streptomyces sp. SID8455]|nr:MFS transporter [Streptomyces sp. SID8455]